MGLPLAVSEYRERKILKRFKVTPVSPVKLLAVEFTIYVLYAAVSMITITLMAILIWKVKIHGSWFAFSGTTLPYEVMPDAMQKVISIFPMTQGIQLMKAAFLGASVNNIRVSIIVMVVVTAVCTGIAVKCFKWE